MTERLIECVPNFSEGRDAATIRRIADQIESVAGVQLLDVDPGKATNRTVYTFAGTPEAVVEAAVRAVREGSQLIDMRRHRGEHPRMGACDVCPLVPIAGVTMDETIAHARELARRLGEELGLTVFCYEKAALQERRRNLAVVRAGEYEGLADKLADPEWQPDFGPARFNPKSGATAVGARDFLIAYNVNLNTTSTRWANAIAFDVREKGRIERRGDPLTGEIVRDEHGQPVWIPGSLKHVKAIGWFIDEYGIAQISMNLTDIEATPIHVAFDEVCRRAEARGVRVTGSEIVGLVPLAAMLAAGRHYLRRQRRSLGIPDREIVRIAAKSMGLADLAPFDADEKVIEYVLHKRAGGRRLIDRTLRAFTEETAAESVAPGGGSVAAAVGALGAALGTMVANLSAHKRGWDDRWEEFSDHAERGKECQDELLALVDRDTDAYNRLVAAFRLPSGSAADQQARDAAIAAATANAIEVPLRTMEVALRSMEVIAAMVEHGNPASVSDAAVGAMCARTAVLGGYWNVRVNCKDLDQAAAARYLQRAGELRDAAVQREAEILAAAGERG